MASKLGYASVDDVANLLLVTVDSSFNTQVEKWISAAESYVNRYTGFTTASGFLNEQITGEMDETHVDGDLNLVIHPRKRPINSFTKLQVVKGSISIDITLTKADGTPKYIIPARDGVIIYPNYELVTTATTFYIRNLVEVKYSRWFTKINYIGGYTTLPDDINLATSLIASDYFMKHANREGLQMYMQGRITKRWKVRKDGKSDYLEDAENILNRYKIGSGWI